MRGAEKGRLADRAGRPGEVKVGELAWFPPAQQVGAAAFIANAIA
jgi:hypothetical protein